jgi:hypothetical protein
MKSNFVIFSESRTGSTALVSALNHQKNILCFEEIFKKNLYSKSSKKFKEKIEKFLGPDHSKWEEKRDEKSTDFIDFLLKTSNKKIFGYKFFEKHFKSFKNQKSYLNFLKINNTKIIILERNNILLKYISGLTAESIDCYSSSVKHKNSQKIFQLNPIEINYDEYIKYYKMVKRQFKNKFKAIKDYNLQYIHITYEDFFGEKFIECFKKIFNFLDLDFQDFIDPRSQDGSIMIGHKKINLYKLENKIINYAEFKKTAENNNDIEALSFLREK